MTETDVKQEQMDTHSLNGKRFGVVSEVVLLTILISLYQQDFRGFKTDFLSTTSVSNRTCICINITRSLLCPYHSTETRVSRPRILTIFLCMYLCPANFLSTIVKTIGRKEVIYPSSFIKLCHLVFELS